MMRSPLLFPGLHRFAALQASSTLAEFGHAFP
jgi:hypothetical protein